MAPRTPSTPAPRSRSATARSRSSASTRCSRRFDVARLPFSLKVLLENLLRNEDGVASTATTSRRSPPGTPRPSPPKEIAFTPARVLMQDFTGVPARRRPRRDARRDGRDGRRPGEDQPARARPSWSSTTPCRSTSFGTRDAFALNAEREFERNEERYAFLRWGQGAFDDFAVVPPDTGIVHQVNLEYLARVVFDDDEPAQAYPDTLVGTDSHTTMINGLGVLGWGVGGIEAEAAMLGQPMSMLIPQVVGFKLSGELPRGRDGDRPRAHRHRDAARAGRRRQVRRVLRRRASPNLPLADRATIGNMSPGVRLDVRDLPDRRRDAALPASSPGRPEEQVELVEAYAQRAGALARRALRGADVLRDARARPRRRRAVARRARSARRTASR